MFTFPSKSIRNLSFAQLKGALEFWDSVLESHFELRGDSPYENRKHWVVADEQPAAGYMLAGYPIGIYYRDEIDLNLHYAVESGQTNVIGLWYLVPELNVYD